MANLKLSYLQKVGGMFVQAIPPTQKKWGGGGYIPPPPPRDLRQCLLDLNVYYVLLNNISFIFLYCTKPRLLKNPQIILCLM